MRKDEEAEFRLWAYGHRGALRRTGFLLCLDWHSVDDLVQETMTKVYLAWPRLERRGEVHGYARQVLVNTFLGTHRRAWRREDSFADVPDAAAREPTATDPVMQQQLWMALRSVPERQRAVLVLRYLED